MHRQTGNPLRDRFSPLPTCLALALVLLAAATSRAATFTNVTSSAGLTTSGVSRGAAWADYNDDGCLDLFVSGNSNRLYRSNCTGAFNEVSGSAGISGPSRSRGAAWADYDGDGDLDLYIASERNSNRLYRNNGNGTFSNVSVSAGVDDERGSIGVSWADYDGDGDLDLWVANRFGNATTTNKTDRLYRNNGNGTFTDMAPSLGISGGSSRLTFMGVWADFDENGTQDLYLAVDFGNDKLYRNNGGTFTDISGSAGITGPAHGMGVAVGDPNMDGCLDVASTNNGHGANGPSVLYRSTCGGAFVNLGDIPDRDYVEWGINFVDYDYDMDEDLSIVAGGMLTPEGEANVLLRNNGAASFTDMTAATGTANGGAAFGSVWADYDGDGDLDWFVANERAGSNVLFRNNGPTGNYLKVELNGLSDDNTYGVGARIEAEVGATTLVRIIQAGHSFESSEELAAYFGLAGNTSVNKLTVLWPSGTVDEFFDLSVNTTFEVDEGAGVAIFTDGFESGDVSAWSVSVP